MEVDVKGLKIKSLSDKDVYTVDEILDIVDELDQEIEHLNDELDNLKQDLEENYRPIPYAEQVDISDSYFL